MGVTWDVWQKLARARCDARFLGERRMDNDQANSQPLIPAQPPRWMSNSPDEYGPFFWSASVLNLFNVSYFDYADRELRSRPAATPPIRWPGRTFMVAAGATF